MRNRYKEVSNKASHQIPNVFIEPSDVGKKRRFTMVETNDDFEVAIR